TQGKYETTVKSLKLTRKKLVSEDIEEVRETLKKLQGVLTSRGYGLHVTTNSLEEPALHLTFLLKCFPNKAGMD
ncbi:hypothetical protein ILYODFUR_033084, partial [Ilyodon furcidens]